MRRLGWKKEIFLISCLFLAGYSKASACYLCQLDNGSLGCLLDIGETGGSSCYVNCKPTPVGDRCFCRTLGICSGTNGCDGHPCPVSVAKSEKQSSIPGRTFLTRETLSALAASNPEVADILSGFVRDNDALELGMSSRAPFIPGEYHGLISLSPPGGRGQTQTFRVEASVTQELDRVVVDVQLFDHPRLLSLHAEISNKTGNLVEVVDSRGRLSLIEM